MSFLAVDLKFLELEAPAIARASRIDEDRVIAGHNRLWKFCWANKTNLVSREDLAGMFGPDRLDALISSAENYTLTPDAEAADFWEVRGVEKYLRVRKSRAEGGKKRAAAAARSGGKFTSSAPAQAGDAASKTPALTPNTEHRAPTKETTHPLSLSTTDDRQREGEYKNDSGDSTTTADDGRKRPQRPRGETNDAETEVDSAPPLLEVLRAFTAVFVSWANDTADAAGGPQVYAWVGYRFQKHAHDEDSAKRFHSQIKLAWADFLAWCAATGKTPGWGLFMEANVGDVRIDEARAGLLPRVRQPDQKALTLGPIGAVPAKKVAT